MAFSPFSSSSSNLKLRGTTTVSPAAAIVFAGSGADARRVVAEARAPRRFLESRALERLDCWLGRSARLCGQSGCLVGSTPSRAVRRDSRGVRGDIFARVRPLTMLQYTLKRSLASLRGGELGQAEALEGARAVCGAGRDGAR